MRAMRDWSNTLRRRNHVLQTEEEVEVVESEEEIEEVEEVPTSVRGQRRQRLRRRRQYQLAWGARQGQLRMGPATCQSPTVLS